MGVEVARSTKVRILQVNASDNRGGAAMVAWSLHQAFQTDGYTGKMAVKRKYSSDLQVQELESKLSVWTAFWKDIAVSPNFRSLPLLSTLCHWLAEPNHHARRILGIEEFDFPASREVDITNYDLIHCHVLHGGYFDLRLLKEWSRKRPVVITLHDAWLLAGHCAHSFTCERWKTGCGSCPDITIPVALEHDNSAFNWKRKKRVFERSTLYVAAPSQWLLNKAKESILASGTRVFRHIIHGVDTNLFCPADRALCRSQLKLPQDVFVVLFAANGIRKNRWKDFPTLITAVRKISEDVSSQNILFVALGQEGQDEDYGAAKIRFISYVADRKEVASYYAAANVYVHTARAETFPNAIVEAMATGIPVVASAVGGIPEQVTGFMGAGFPELNTSSIEQANGILIPPENSDALADTLRWLLKRPAVVEQLGRQARAHALRHFDIRRQIEEYKCLYSEVLADFNSSSQFSFSKR